MLLFVSRYNRFFRNLKATEKYKTLNKTGCCLFSINYSMLFLLVLLIIYEFQINKSLWVISRNIVTVEIYRRRNASLHYLLQYYNMLIKIWHVSYILSNC